MLLSSLTTEIRTRIQDREGRCRQLVLLDFDEALDRCDNRREQIRCCYAWLHLLKRPYA